MWWNSRGSGPGPSPGSLTSTLRKSSTSKDQEPQKRHIGMQVTEELSDCPRGCVCHPPHKPDTPDSPGGRPRPGVPSPHSRGRGESEGGRVTRPAAEAVQYRNKNPAVV